MNESDIQKWNCRFLDMAELLASWSKDPSTQCGAVIIRRNKTICSVGYNGFPRTMADKAEWLTNRELKYQRVIHAEMNAILTAPESVNGYILYVWPIPPCDRCAAHIAQAGVSHVVAPGKLHDSELWGRANCDLALEILRESMVTYELVGI